MVLHEAKNDHWDSTGESLPMGMLALTPLETGEVFPDANGNAYSDTDFLMPFFALGEGEEDDMGDGDFDEMEGGDGEDFDDGNGGFDDDDRDSDDDDDDDDDEDGDFNDEDGDFNDEDGGYNDEDDYGYDFNDDE